MERQNGPGVQGLRVVREEDLEGFRMSDPIEWEFGCPASQVDLSRLYSELASLPAIYAFSYVAELKKNAPTVYRRLADHLAANGVISEMG
jgi:hypothetical protein